MKTGIVKDRRYMEHDMGPFHVETPQRLESIYRMIEEKIVYKEDDTTINALREKRDRLIEKNHHYIDQVKDLEHYKEQFDELRQVVDDWKRHNFAVMYQNGTSTDRSQKNSLKIIDSKTYFEYKANPEMFKKKYKLNNSIVVKEIPYSIV